MLFIRGAGEGVHDSWDGKRVESLRGALPTAYEVRCPRMPKEDDPSYTSWSAVIRRELKTLTDGAVAVGHSVGGTILLGVLADRAQEPRLSGIVVIAAPFVGPGGWPSDEWELPAVPPRTLSSTVARYRPRWSDDYRAAITSSTMT